MTNLFIENTFSLVTSLNNAKLSRQKTIKSVLNLPQYLLISDRTNHDGGKRLQ